MTEHPHHKVQHKVHHKTHSKKSNFWKLVVSFLAGAVVTTVVLLAVTGALFTGGLRFNDIDFRGTPEEQVSKLPEPITPVDLTKICNITNCDLDKKLDLLIRLFNEHTSAFNDYTGHFQNISDAFNNFTEDFGNLSDAFNEFTEDFNNYTDLFNNLTEDFNDHTNDFNNFTEDFHNFTEDFGDFTEEFGNFEGMMGEFVDMMIEFARSAMTVLIRDISPQLQEELLQPINLPKK